MAGTVFLKIAIMTGEAGVSATVMVLLTGIESDLGRCLPDRSRLPRPTPRATHAQPCIGAISWKVYNAGRRTYASELNIR